MEAKDDHQTGGSVEDFASRAAVVGFGLDLTLHLHGVACIVFCRRNKKYDTPKYFP